MSRSAKIGSLALILFGVLYLSSFVFASPFVGLEDGDNPASSLEFVRQHGNFFFLSGLCAVAAAVALIVGGLALADTVLQPPASLLGRTTATLGTLAAAFFFAHGVLRMNSIGLLPYIDGLNHDWGLAAYTVVHIAGTIGLASAGVFALSLWAIGVSLAGWRGHSLPKAMTALGFVPALPWVMGLLGHVWEMPEGLWLVYISSVLLGIPLWCAALGAALLRWKPSALSA